VSARNPLSLAPHPGEVAGVERAAQVLADELRVQVSPGHFRQMQDGSHPVLGRFAEHAAPRVVPAGMHRRFFYDRAALKALARALRRDPEAWGFLKAHDAALEAKAMTEAQKVAKARRQRLMDADLPVGEALDDLRDALDLVEERLTELRRQLARAEGVA
jgi:hypothetical protein